MISRVTSTTVNNSLVGYIQQNYADYAKLTEQLSTGKKINFGSFFIYFSFAFAILYGNKCRITRILHQNKKQKKGNTLWQPVRHAGRRMFIFTGALSVAKSVAMQQRPPAQERMAFARDNRREMDIPV